MKILTVCAEGNNRSVHFAHLLRYKYKGSDIIPIGSHSFSEETKKMLCEWADVIIILETKLQERMPEGYEAKTKVWNVGPDIYKRPFNPELYNLAKMLIETYPLK